jgi:uncharacterized protein YbjT (DUF2867 family)
MKCLSIITLIPYASCFSGQRMSNLASRSASPLFATSNPNEDHESSLSRRDMFQSSMKGLALASLLSTVNPSSQAFAEEEPTPASSSIDKIVVAGATGQTGSRIYNRLLAQSSITVKGGVRNVDKAAKSFPKGSTLSHLDVVEDSLADLTQTLQGSNGLIIACGMNPTKNLLRMSKAAHEVDNVGTIKLIDAAKEAGVKKVVLVSSILTNGREWGQESSPGFVATNAFGGALDEKLAAEKHLRASGLDYTIVRPGGLKGSAPAGELTFYKEDSLNSGEVSRDFVADACVAALNEAKASNTVVEIIENESKPVKPLFWELM